MKPHVPILLLLGLVVPLAPATARMMDGLTRCETTVTGQGEAERNRGLGICLTEVLVKVAARPGLADDPRLAGLLPAAAGAVESIAYEDRMKDLPVGDEQGTRDRPYYLRVTFRAGTVVDMLAALGLKPWGADRPVLGVVVVSKRDGQAWIVARGIPGVTKGAQVDALDDAGRRFAMPLALPEQAALVSLGLDPAAPLPADLAAKLGADALLTGTLDWDDAALGWRATWTLADSKAAPWSLAGVSFDDAFRAGVGGAAALLSGADQPR